MNSDAKGRKDTGIQTTVRFDPWTRDEIDNLAKSRGLTFTDMVNHLLEYQLNEMGFSRAKYEAKIFGLERGENHDTKGIAVDISDSKFGDNTAIGGSSVIATPLDGMGISGDVLSEVRKMDDKNLKELLKIARELNKGKK